MTVCRPNGRGGSETAPTQYWEVGEGRRGGGERRGEGGEYSLMVLISGSSLGDLFGGSVWSILYNVGFLLGSVAAFVIGILLYIRLRQFLVGKYPSYVGLRNLALAFMILAIIFNGFFPMLMLFVEPSLKVFLTLLCPFAVIFEALASFFTVTRLKSEY